LNDVIYPAFHSQKNLLVCLELTVKRLDGLTLIPWQAGTPLTWDVTVSHIFADSYVPSTSVIPDGAAEMAANRKTETYAILMQT
jgi:hypothetical protein